MAKKKKTQIEHLENRRINWFPGHMNKAIREIKKNIKLVNIVIEVRDARAPLASGNKENYEKNDGKPYLIVLNKSNLSDPNAIKLWQEWFVSQNESFLFINALDKKSIKEIIQRSKEILLSHRLKSNENAIAKDKMKMMILGLPNTGKSTIINKLAKREATKAASTPGQTKVPIWVKVDKDLEILDTPGVMPPRITKQIHGMWLSAIHALPDHIVPPDDSASFIVEHLIKIKSKVFQDHYELESLEIDLITACEHIARRRGCLRTGGVYDYDQTYKIILNDFRKGHLGQTSFEFPPVRK